MLYILFLVRSFTFHFRFALFPFFSSAFTPRRVYKSQDAIAQGSIRICVSGLPRTVYYW